MFLFIPLPEKAQASSNTWIQTTQADFDEGTKSNIDTSTSLGDATISKLSWWNDNYQYIKRITVSTGAVATGSDYSVLIDNFDTATLITDGKMRNDSTDANDLRILYWDGSSWTELDRDVIGFNTASTDIWFKLQANINTNSSDNNYYLYYGYTSETSSPPSNKSNVYGFWDDFNDNSIDVTKWTTVGTVVESGEYLTIGSTIASYTYGATSFKSAVFEAKLKWGSTSSSPYVYGGFAVTPTPGSRYLFFSENSWSVYNYNNGFQQTTNSVITDPLNWHTYKIKWESGIEGQYFIDDTIVATHTTYVPSENLKAYFRAADNYYIYVDDVKIRKYVNPEPTLNLGIEQTSNNYQIFTSSGTLTSSAYDVNLASNFSSISWTDITPTNTTLKFQIRTATTQNRLSLASWYGPTSTSDYYTTSDTTINSVHNGDRWIQYKLFLSTTDDIITPTLSDVGITYSDLSITDVTQPILVLTDSNSSNVYNNYITEILDTEGILSYQSVDIYLYNITLSYLNNFDTVILSDTSSLSSDLVTALTSYVNNGGNLIGLSPDTQLASVFGLTNLGATTSEQYLKVDTDTTIGNGVTSTSMQFHSEADDYSLNGASSIALIYSDASTPTTKPAITLYQYGSGSSVSFTYDLAKSTVLFHQGVYAQRSTDMDEDGRYTQRDLFINYLDTNKADIPQADEQQDLLVGAINYLAGLKKPLPRLWYYPDKAMSITWITGDGDHSTSAQIQTYADKTREYGGYFTLFEGDSNEFNDTLDNSLQADGHSIGKHATLNVLSTLAEAQSSLNTQLQAFITSYGHQPLTDRQHSLVWVGWTEQAKYLSDNGVRINSNATCYGITASKSYLNGSGLPMKFMDENGDIVDLYEQSTVLYERNSSTTVDESFDNYHSVLTYNFHPIISLVSMVETAASYSQSKGIPMISGDTWANFVDARRDMHFQNIQFTGGAVLTFDITQGTHSIDNATIMVPTNYDSLSVELIQEEETTKSYTTSTIDGRSYALFNVSLNANQTKSYTIKYDNTPPSSVGIPTFGITTSSSIEIIKPTTVIEEGSGLYQWQARRNETTELGFNTTSTVSVTDSSLSENTQYTYDVKFEDNANNISTYSTQISKYTLADTPTNLSASSNSNDITLTVDSFSNDTSGSSGYYFSNSTKGINSGWIQTNSWQETGLSCGTPYTYSVKYRNGNGTLTDIISITKSTSGCTSSGSTQAYRDKFLAEQQAKTLILQQPTTVVTIPITSPALNITKTLKQGIKGDDVKELQNYLNTHGYDCGTADGSFGPKTKAEVILFQKANGLGADGIVGPKTREKMNQPLTSTSPTTLNITRTLKQGMKGNDVKELQNYLNTHGYDCGTADGSFGPKTKAEVILFQKANGLGADGIVGLLTKEKIK